MEISQLNPHIRYVGRHCASPLKSGYSICYDCRLFYITAGSGSVKIKGEQTIKLNKHDVLFFPSHTLYKFFPENESFFELLVFNFDLTTQYIDKKKSLGTASEDTFDETRVLICDSPESFKKPIILNKMHRVFENMLKAEKEFSLQNPNYTALASAYIKLALVLMVSETTIENETSGTVAAVCSYIKQNGTSNLTNEDIAREFHYHPHYLSKIMKEEIGFTLHQYIIYNQIVNAKKLLVSTNLSVETIAWKVGFSSTSYFIKMFRRDTGQTPKQYRTKKQKIYF